MTGSAPECVALAEGLRETRALTGLSLAALAERTAYSKSSWERYLNGKKPVPRQAVEALCAMAGEPAGRLLALWELADTEWSGRARHTRPSAEPPPTSAPTSLPMSALVPAAAVGAPGVHRRVRRQGLFIAGVGVVAVAMLAAQSLRSHSAAGSPASPALDPIPGCQGKACDGKDPSPMACGLPGRVDSLGPPHPTSTDARVEIRYSQVCAAAWGRIWHSKVGDAIEVSAPGARSHRVVVRNAADTGVYRFTPMIGGPNRTDLRLCFIPAGGTDRECFDS
ncbi:helix-turn-helix domain-containing protein [Streptomyces sp. NBC_01314]|uniref:helix-turn-helix domain-containing protein n=1 Tax=Streptomyces sp. NBC_01314 TaxID=2903821 RepID=UPI0030898311|nr:XRE family transcriptional regulator [Streptomyces sp. NBC_01314]